MTHYRVIPHNGTPRGTQFASTVNQIAIGLLSFFVLISTAQAQNRVVVIPMPAEDAPLTPLRPSPMSIPVPVIIHFL